MAGLISAFTGTDRRSASYCVLCTDCVLVNLKEAKNVNLLYNIGIIEFDY